MDSNIQVLVENFVKQIVASVEATTAQRVQAAIATALNGGAIALPRRRGRPPKSAYLVSAPVASLAAPAKKKRPKQLCPVPGCTGLAAPVFGMVCSKHKDLPKDKIKKFRAQRREAAKK